MVYTTNSALIEGLITFSSKVMTPQSNATTLNGTLTLTVASSVAQYITGTATGYSVVLPDATTLSSGHRYEIFNTSSQPITIKANGGDTLFVLSQTSVGYIILQTNTPAAGVWISHQAYADQTIATGIIHYNITSSTLFSTSSTTDVAITSFTLTPVIGEYLILYNGSVTTDTNNSVASCTFYNNGVAITDSLRNFKGQTSSYSMIQSTMTVASFNGTSACDVRVKMTGGGSISITDRTLIMVRLSN